MLNNNKAFLTGTILEEPTFSHETFGEGFYEIKLSVPRLSEHMMFCAFIVWEKMLKTLSLVKLVGIKDNLGISILNDGKSKLIFKFLHVKLLMLINQ